MVKHVAIVLSIIILSFGCAHVSPTEPGIYSVNDVTVYLYEDKLSLAHAYYGVTGVMVFAPSLKVNGFYVHETKTIHALKGNYRAISEGLLLSAKKMKIKAAVFPPETP